MLSLKGIVYAPFSTTTKGKAMRVNCLLIPIAIVLIAAASAPAEPIVLFDFEDGPQGWEVDWGLDSKPATASRYASNGKQSLALEHTFGKDKEAIAVLVILKEIADFTSLPGFEGVSAWVYLPTGNFWEAQVYVKTGPNWNISWGSLHQQLASGWHKVVIRKDEIADPADVRAIGVQIKNYSLSTQTKVYVDYVQA
ncbi:MAG: hypothetical protein JXB04_01230, partial [Kiritimatiellae bacterium]|nr:hypothetical protein [Kiritimatiellia bacterium]